MEASETIQELCGPLSLDKFWQTHTKKKVQSEESLRIGFLHTVDFDPGKPKVCRKASFAICGGIPQGSRKGKSAQTTT